MTVNTKLFLIMLEASEVNDICDCLQVGFCDLKEKQNEAVNDLPEYMSITEKITRVRTLRDAFGDLIGRKWMGGKDA